MIRRFAFPIALLAVIAVPAASVRAESPSLTRTLLGSEDEAKGDFDTWLGALSTALAGDVESPFAVAAITKIRALMADATDPALVDRTLDPVLARGVRDGDTDEALRVVLAERARARGEFEKADQLGESRGYLRRFAVVGPFGWTNAVLVHRKYAPEGRALDMSGPMEGAYGPVRWVPVSVLGTSPWISPSQQIRRGRGVVYAIARVKSAGARTVAIKTSCSDSFAVFVNGAPTIVADRVRDSVPTVAWGTARLEAGWNRVLVKVAGTSAFTTKLCDAANGLPMTDLEEGDPLVGTELPASTGVADARGYQNPSERAVAAAKGDAAALGAAALVCSDAGCNWDAYGAYEAALSAAAGSTDGALAANLHAAFGRFLATFNEIPDVQRKLRAKAEFEAAGKAYPAHNSAAIRLAEYQNDDDHPDLAVKALRAHLKHRPTALGWMAVARVAKARGWEREALDAARAASKLSPNHKEALRFLLEFDQERGDAAEAAALNRRLLAVNANDGSASFQVVSELRAQGKHADALALLRTYADRWPGSLGWRLSVADVLHDLDRDDEAIAQWRALAAIVPLEDDYPRQIAEVLESKGDKPGAIASYQKSLELQPYQPTVWRALARLEGRDADFSAPFEPDVAELVAKLPATEDLKKRYPKAVAITVLDHDVVRVRPDGSSESYIHMVYKLLDEKGVQKYGDVDNAGELLEVRAFLPDGRVMAPSGIPGRAYNMEGLVPGAVIEHRYYASNAGTPKGYDGGLFHFQDHGADEPNPVVLSRLVVITPAGMKLDPSKRNYDGDPVVATKDGLTTTTWEKRELPRIEPERFMPEAEEIVAHVDYTRSADGDDTRWQLLGSRQDTRPTPLLEGVVRKVVKDGMSDIDKLHALYDWINDEITGRAGGGGPTATVLQKSGDRGQLFEALVRIAGVPYRNGRAMPWSDATQSGPTRAGSSPFTQPFLWLEPKGASPMPFVMMSRYSPFGLMPDSYRGSTCLVYDDEGGSIRTLPSAGPETLDFTQFEVLLGADPKTARVTGTVNYRGPEDYDNKQRVLEMPEDARKKWAENTFNRYFVSPALERVTFPGVEKKGEPFVMALEGTMSNYLEAQGGVFVVGLGLPEVGMVQRYVERPERVYDLVLTGRSDSLDEFTIVLGDAFAVKTLPKDCVVVHRLGTYSLTWRESNGRVAVRREMHLRPVRYRADEFKGFAAWCKAIDDAEDQKLELRKTK